MKKKLKIYQIILIVVGILFAMTIAALVVTKMNLDEITASNDANIAEMVQNQKTVYVVSTEDGLGIEHGEIILDGVNVTRQTVYTGLESFNYITDEDIGSTAIVDMDEGMTVMKNMVTPLTIATDTREYEVQVANLMVDQKENDLVDIRIMFPDGSDFLILPKKQVKNLNLENCVFWTYLNEEEILRLASATIDAYTITGTKIYAARYVEGNLQKEAIPTYLVNGTVQDMMDASTAYYDQNLLTKAISTLNLSARKNLEERLGHLSEEKLGAVAEGHGLEDTAKKSVLTGIGGYDYEDIVNEVQNESTANESSTSESETTTNVDRAMEDLQSSSSLENAKQTEELNKQMEEELNSNSIVTP